MPSSPSPPALPQADEIWPELRLHLEWAHGFSLIFLFGGHGAASRLRAYCEAAQRERGAALEVLAPTDPAQAGSEVLKAALAAPGSGAIADSPLWIELYRHPDDREWDAARRFVVARLNERRYLLERDFRRALVLVLPENYRDVVRELAPDLWAVRTFSAAVAPPRPVPGVAIPEPVPAFAPVAAPAAAPGRAEADPRIQEWERLKSVTDRTRVSPSDGLAAVDAAIERGDFRLAERIAAETVDLARQRVATLGATPATRRDLGVALGRLGDAAQRLGKFDEATATYRECYDVWRALIDELGDATEAQLGVILALNGLGHVAQDRGESTDALARFQEGLKIARALYECAPNDRTRGAVIVSLGGIADALLALGKIEDAYAAYREGADLWLQLREHTPQTLEELSFVFSLLGETAHRLGRLEEAEAACRESVDLRRVLRQLTGDTPLNLSMLSYSLSQLGDIAWALGKPDEAAAAHRESLDLRRAVHARVGDTPEALGDLYRGLEKIARVAWEAGRAEEARRYADEAADIVERLGRAHPEHPSYEALRAELQALRDSGPGRSEPLNEIHQPDTAAFFPKEPS